MGSMTGERRSSHARAIWVVVAHANDRADRLLKRHIGIGTVKLVEVDAVQAEPAQAALQRFPQVLRPPVRRPLTRAGPLEPAFGGDHKALGIRMERFADDPLA